MVCEFRNGHDAAAGQELMSAGYAGDEIVGAFDTSYTSDSDDNIEDDIAALPFPTQELRKLISHVRFVSPDPEAGSSYVQETKPTLMHKPLEGTNR